MAELQDRFKDYGRVVATARLPEINAYIRKVNKAPRPLTPEEISVLRQEIDAQMRVIKRNWPVRTGYSRAGWQYTIVPSPGRVAVVFQNRVHYSARVTKKGQTPVRSGGTPWYQVLIPEVWRAGKPRLLRRLKEQIDKTQIELQGTPEPLQSQVGQRVLRQPSRTERRSGANALQSLIGRIL
jgi:hypothetical protein